MSSTRTSPSPAATSHSSSLLSSGSGFALLWLRAAALRRLVLPELGRPRCWWLTRCVPSGEAPACPITVAVGEPQEHTESAAYHRSPQKVLTASPFVGKGYASLWLDLRTDVAMWLPADEKPKKGLASTEGPYHAVRFVGPELGTPAYAAGLRGALPGRAGPGGLAPAPQGWPPQEAALPPLLRGLTLGHFATTDRRMK